ncbi:MAG TPA: TerC/Alx family metal homeostasis membrane protein [Desulfobacterales bacterium]|nr:TerC/Alx family metal homeostasis membrane protein [Desulfobacterales bacterium]
MNLLNIAVFLLVITVFLILDLRSHRQDKPVSPKNAAIWSGIWIAVSLAFAGYLSYSQGTQQSSLFLTGYLLEKSLSVDNMFVFMAVFTSFGITDKYQHRVLYYGIVGALVLRFVFITAGTCLLGLGDWVLAVCGLFVLWTAWKMWKASKQEAFDSEDYTNHWSVRGARRILPVYPKLVGHNFFTKAGGRLAVTPLFLCLVCVDVVDLVFAFDSVPVVVAVTQEPFLIYTSNIFAILGLRSLYFLLSSATRSLIYLEKVVIGILFYIGAKMIAAVTGIYHVPAMVSLGVVASGVALGILASLILPSPSITKIETRRCGSSDQG